MDKQEPIFDSAATSAEEKTAQAAAAESKPVDDKPAAAKAEAAAEKKTDKVISFPMMIYTPWIQYRRYAAIAASVAVALALGCLIGSASTYSLTAAAPKADPAEPNRALQASLTQVTKDVAALKTSIEASSKSAGTQMAKINERFDRSEKAQAEPAARIAALTESVARIEKRLAAAPAAAAPTAAVSRDITGSIPERTAAAAPPKDQSKPATLEGWVLREVYRGRALVENRNELYEVAPGADLPGAGKVQTITRQDGRWVVTTQKGLIVSMR
jgi:hypothetical protein